MVPTRGHQPLILILSQDTRLTLNGKWGNKLLGRVVLHDLLLSRYGLCKGFFIQSLSKLRQKTADFRRQMNGATAQVGYPHSAGHRPQQP